MDSYFPPKFGIDWVATLQEMEFYGRRWRRRMPAPRH